MCWHLRPRLCCVALAPWPHVQAALPGGEFIPPGPSKPPADPDVPWLCDECELRVHRCYLCKHYARDEVGGRAPEKRRTGASERD